MFNGAKLCGALVVLVVTGWNIGNAAAQGISVGSSASFTVGDGSVDLGCGDLSIGGSVTIGSGTFTTMRDVNVSAGALFLGSGSMSLSGDWTNSGTVSAGAGLVTFVDGCGTNTSNIAGDTDFYDFSAVTSGGRLLQLAAGSTQTFGNSITLQGSGADPLTIRSSSPGSETFFVLPEGATQNILGVDVADNNADGGQTLAPVAPEDVDSVDTGNNSNWFIAMLPEIIAKPVTAIPLPGLLLLSGLLILLARRYQRPVPTIETMSP